MSAVLDGGQLLPRFDDDLGMQAGRARHEIAHPGDRACASEAAATGSAGNAVSTPDALGAAYPVPGTALNATEVRAARSPRPEPDAPAATCVKRRHRLNPSRRWPRSPSPMRAGWRHPARATNSRRSAGRRPPSRVGTPNAPRRIPWRCRPLGCVPRGNRRVHGLFASEGGGRYRRRRPEDDAA